MASDPIEDMRDRLMAAVSVTAILTGGVYIDRDAGEFPLHPRKDGAGDLLDPWEEVPGLEGVEGAWRLKPCAVLSASTRVPSGNRRKQQLHFVRIGFYQPEGYELIRAAMEAVEGVLDPEGAGSAGGPLDDGRWYHVRYVDTPIQGSRDDQIVSADTEAAVSYEASRFQVQMSR